ncbi:MAG: cyclic nucleotide-binding domain-containing protein [Sandaracinaceae bacterium]
MSRPEPMIGKVERFVALRSFGGWDGLPTKEIALIASLTRPRRFKRGDTVFVEGEPVDSVYMVISGNLSLRRKGRELGRYGPRSGVGGLAGFARDPDGYDCVALEDTLTLEVDIEDIEEVLEERFHILLTMLRGMARQSIQVRQTIPSAGFTHSPDAGTECPAHRLNPVERMFYMRRTPMGAGRIDSIAELSMRAEEIRAAEGEVLWRRGDAPDTLVMIICGRIRGETDNGTTFEFGAGDLVGALDTVSDLPRWYEATVVDGLVALELHRDQTLDLWEDHPDLAMQVLRGFSGGLLRLLSENATTIDTLNDGLTLQDGGLTIQDL